MDKARSDGQRRGFYPRPVDHKGGAWWPSSAAAERQTAAPRPAAPGEWAVRRQPSFGIETAADMVRMGVDDDDHVDLIGANAGKRSAFTEVRLREALQAAAVEEMTGGEPYTHISR